MESPPYVNVGEKGKSACVKYEVGVIRDSIIAASITQKSFLFYHLPSEVISYIFEFIAQE